MAPRFDLNFRIRDIDLDVAQLNRRNGTVNKATRRAAREVAQDARRIIRRKGLIESGNLLRSIDFSVRHAGSRGVTATISADTPYALFIHEGTANNGAGFIFPTQAKALRFKPKGSATVLYRAKVRGIKGTPFLTDALNRLRIQDFRR